MIGVQHSDAPPFERGTTWGASNPTWPRERVIGGIWEFDDVEWGNTYGKVKPTRSNRIVKCMAVLNGGGIAMLPTLLYAMKLIPDYGVTNGQVAAAGTLCYACDEFLPAAGCPVGDVCWVVVSGPHTVLAAAADYDVGDVVVSSVTGGTGAKALIGITMAQMSQGFVGLSLEDKTLGASGLLRVDRRRW